MRAWRSVVARRAVARTTARCARLSLRPGGRSNVAASSLDHDAPQARVEVRGEQQLVAGVVAEVAAHRHLGDRHALPGSAVRFSGFEVARSSAETAEVAGAREHGGAIADQAAEDRTRIRNDL